MKVILYIGHHKVGSTALQAFLSQNWLRLAKDGILYPMVESEGMAFALETALRGEDRPGLLPLNVREPHNALAFRMNAVEQGRQPPRFLGQLPALPQIQRNMSMQIAHLAPHTVVLCSEVMANFSAINPEMISKLKDMFPKAEFEIYCTLRRPDDYLVSWQAQRLRFGEKPGPLASRWSEMYAHTIHFDYRFLLAPWLERFGGSRFHIRSYSDVLSAGGSAEDFAGRVGVRFPKGLKPAPRANPSLALAFMEIVRRGNHALTPPAAQALFGYLLKEELPSELKDKSRIDMFGATSRAAMATAFAPIHDYLGEVAGCSPFFSDIASMETPREIPESAATRLALRALAKAEYRNCPSPEVRAFLEGLMQESET